jgi:hypothetical protein
MTDVLTKEMLEEAIEKIRKTDVEEIVLANAINESFLILQYYYSLQQSGVQLSALELNTVRNLAETMLRLARRYERRYTKLPPIPPIHSRMEGMKDWILKVANL